MLRQTQESRLLPGFCHTEDACNLARNQVRIDNVCEIDNKGAVGKIGQQRGRGLKREQCLADAPRAGQDGEPYIRATQQFANFGQLFCAADERRDLGRQIVRAIVEAANRRKVRSQT